MIAMKISIAGTGYVGLTTGVGFAVKGNDVTCVDVVQEKVERINRGESPIYEPLLDEYLKKVIKEGSFRATTDLKDAVSKTEVTFISVGTPSGEGGKIDLRFIEQVSGQISKHGPTSSLAINSWLESFVPALEARLGVGSFLAAQVAFEAVPVFDLIASVIVGLGFGHPAREAFAVEVFELPGEVFDDLGLAAALQFRQHQPIPNVPHPVTHGASPGFG